MGGNPLPGTLLYLSLACYFHLICGCRLISHEQRALHAESRPEHMKVAPLQEDVEHLFSCGDSCVGCRLVLCLCFWS